MALVALLGLFSLKLNEPEAIYSELHFLSNQTQAARENLNTTIKPSNRRERERKKDNV